MSDTSEESDGEIKILPKRTETRKQNKNGALWKQMLEEESLMEDMKTCEVAKNRKRKIDRGAETYSYNDHEKRSDIDEGLSAQCSERKKFKVTQNRNKIDRQSINLPDLTITDSTDVENLVADIADKLNEENKELIKKVFSAIGRDKCIHFYTKTQKIERKGGLLTVNKQRRRTSGGIFLFLIKTSNEITDEQKKQIFEKDTAG